MTKKKKGDDGPSSEVMTIKIKRQVYRTIKMIAAWKEMTAMDYIEELVKKEATPELARMAIEIQAKQHKVRPPVDD